MSDQQPPVRDSPEDGSTGALFSALYDELHRLAERQLRRGGFGASLSTTTLLHEAYLGMSSRQDIQFPDRARFMAYAARAMRGIVVDYARRGGSAAAAPSRSRSPRMLSRYVRGAPRCRSW